MKYIIITIVHDKKDGHNYELITKCYYFDDINKIVSNNEEHEVLYYEIYKVTDKERIA